MYVARRVLRGLWINRVCFRQGTENPLIVSVLNLFCRNAFFFFFYKHFADGKDQMVARCPAGMETPRAAWQPSFHPSLVGMQMWELQSNGHPVDITALFHTDFAPGVIFGGGTAELWRWGPPINLSWGLRSVLFFSKGQQSS